MTFISRTTKFVDQHSSLLFDILLLPKLGRQVGRVLAEDVAPNLTPAQAPHPRGPLDALECLLVTL